MNGTIVILRSTYKDSKEDIRCFDSVSACAIYFAHEARRQYAERGMTIGDIFNAVVSDVALLFAGSTTGEDPEEVNGGNDNMLYSYELHSCADVKTAVASAEDEDEADAEGRVCRKCGHQLTRRNVTPGYRFYCPNCDEDMYGIEAKAEAEDEADRKFRKETKK